MVQRQILNTNSDLVDICSRDVASSYIPTVKNITHSKYYFSIGNGIDFLQM